MCTVPDNTIFNTAELVEFMQKYRVTEIMFTPSLAETLLATTQNVSIQIPTLQVVWLNGEVGNKLAAAAANLSLVQVVTSKLLETCEQKMPRVRVFNTYSISECGEVLTRISNASARAHRSMQGGCYRAPSRPLEAVRNRWSRCKVCVTPDHGHSVPYSSARTAPAWGALGLRKRH